MVNEAPREDELIEGFEGKIKVIMNFDQTNPPIGKAIASRIGKRVSIVLILEEHDGERILDFLRDKRPLALSFLTTPYPGMREEN